MCATSEEELIEKYIVEKRLEMSVHEKMGTFAKYVKSNRGMIGYRSKR